MEAAASRPATLPGSSNQGPLLQGSSGMQIGVAIGCDRRRGRASVVGAAAIPAKSAIAAKVRSDAQ